MIDHKYDVSLYTANFKKMSISNETPYTIQEQRSKNRSQKSPNREANDKAYASCMFVLTPQLWFSF